MEFINVYIKNEKFKLPVTHIRLKHLVANKFNVEDSNIEFNIEDLYNVRKTDCSNLLVEDQRVNIFLLNFYLALMKTERAIDIDSSTNTDVESLILEISNFLKVDISFEEAVFLMNNPKEIRNFITKKNNQSVKEMFKEKTYSINMLRQKQKEIDNQN